MTDETELIHPELPLSILRALQSQDMPAELLPDEDPGASFPQRLGLSGVIENQIREFRQQARRRRGIEISRVEALLQLIARRPDAERVFDAAGRELARLRFAGVVGRLRHLARKLPDPLRKRSAGRALRAGHGSVIIAESIDVRLRPFELRAEDPLTARVGQGGAACRLYGALAASLLELLDAGPAHSQHPECQARGDASCLWRVELR